MSTYDQKSSSETDQDVPTGHSTRKVFGIKKSLPSGAQGNASGKFDYEQKYAEDLPGEEIGEYARVWLTYLDETEQYDRDKVDSWKDTIDILLVFAGLFSAVVTTFVIQSTQNLQTDYTQVSASLLFELVQIQRAIMNGVPAESVSPSPNNPNTPFVPSVADSVVNALWFTSLALALVTTLLAVLTKQWLYQYSSLISGTPRERSRIRQFRSKGLETWKVGTIVESLPVLMHGALALFLAGLVIFLIPLKTEIAWIIGLTAGLTYICYVVSAILPIFYPQCPYTTILTNISRIYWGLAQWYWYFFISLGILYTRRGEWQQVNIKRLVRLMTITISSLLSCSYRYFHSIYYSCVSLGFIGDLGLSSLIPPPLLIIPLAALRSVLAHRPRLLLPSRPIKLRNDREKESGIVKQNGLSIDIDAISSLYSVSTNPSVRRVIIQSICALPYGINRHLLIDSKSLYEDLFGLVHEEDYLPLHVGTLRRLIFAWLQYGDAIGGDVIHFLDPQKIYSQDSGLARLCAFLKQHPSVLLVHCIKGNTLEISWPLVVWSFLFRWAEYQDMLWRNVPPAPLTETLLTWAPAKKLFTWSDNKITLISDQDPVTLSQLSTKYPDIIGKWIFNYMSQRFHVSFDRQGSELISLGEDLYTRYHLFRTIYSVLTASSNRNRQFNYGSRKNSSLILSLVQNFETYITSVIVDTSGSPNDLNELTEAFERNIMWSDVFFEDEFIMPQTRIHLIQTYNILHKVHAPSEPVRENTMRCIHDHLARLNASSEIESPTDVVLHLLTVITLPRFCEFLCNLQDPRLDLVLIHSRQGMTSSHAKSLLSLYKGASRNPLTRLNEILYNPFVLQELCECMVLVDCSHYLLEIACLNPSSPGWKDCYKHLLNSIEEEFYSRFEIDTNGQDSPEDDTEEDIPPAPLHQINKKKWFLLYLLCYHLRSVLKVDLSGAEFTLLEISDMFPQIFSQLSQGQIRDLNVLVLEGKKTGALKPSPGTVLYRSLKKILRPTIYAINPDNEHDNLFVQISPV